MYTHFLPCRLGLRVRCGCRWREVRAGCASLCQACLDYNLRSRDPRYRRAQSGGRQGKEVCRDCQLQVGALCLRTSPATASWDTNSGFMDTSMPPSPLFLLRSKASNTRKYVLCRHILNVFQVIQFRYYRN